MTEQDTPSSSNFAPLSPFSISARIGRIRFMAYMTTILLCMVVIIFGEFLILGDSFFQYFQITVAFNLILMLILLICSGIFIAKRFRDFNAPTFLAIPATLFLLHPFTYILIIGLLSIIPGKNGPNKYGAPPPPNSKGNVVLAFVLVAMIAFNIFNAYTAIKKFEEFLLEAQKLQQQQQVIQNSEQTPPATEPQPNQE